MALLRNQFTFHSAMVGVRTPIVMLAFCLFAKSSVGGRSENGGGGLRGAPRVPSTVPELREFLLELMEPGLIASTSLSSIGQDTYELDQVGDVQEMNEHEELPEDLPLIERLKIVEASLAPTYHSLPTNKVGRLTQRGVRHTVHHYFAKEHGWLIAGLEPHGMRDDASQVEEVSILRDRAPGLVQKLRLEGHLDLGLSLPDVAALAVLLERLVVNEAKQVLEDSYRFNGHLLISALTETELEEVIFSYLLLLGSHEPTSADEHQLFRELAAEDDSGHYEALRAFGREALKGVLCELSSASLSEDDVVDADNVCEAGANGSQRFSFHTAMKVIEALVLRYGRWQESECQAMKRDLVGLEAHAHGLVAMNRFYGHTSPEGHLFHESLDYLRQIGAVDDQSPRGPQVRIPNYVLGPSNCVSSSSYHSVCCLSECEVLMSSLEGQLLNSTAPADMLLELVANLESQSVAAPRQLPRSLSDRLWELGRKSDGQVNLHGRLFAEWLHAAFPRECPYPHIVQDADVLKAGHFDPMRHTVSEERRNVEASELQRQKTGHGRNIEESAAEASVAESAESCGLQWSEEEVLPLVERRAPLGGSGVAAAGDALRLAVLLALCAVVLRSAFGSLSSASTAALGARKNSSKCRSVASSLPM